MTGLKRSLEEASHDGDSGASPQDAALAKPASPAASSSSSAASSFRNVSACNRCRLRKNRCDQRLPSCASCDKAAVKCVGYDPITKREIPRSYVYYLETRVAYLESLLQDNSIAFAPAEDFNPSHSATSTAPGAAAAAAGSGPQQRNGTSKTPQALTKEDHEKYDREKLTKLVSNIGMVSVQGASDPRFLGSTSGISFARVVFAAVKSSVSGSSSERGSVRGSKSVTGNVADGGSGTSMRDSFFGLHTKPAIRQAPFPDRDLGTRLVELYFEHANPQIPILHRGEFMEMFERVYASGERHRTSRESYMLNIVFAIGAGIIMGSSDSSDSPGSDAAASPTKSRSSPPSSKKRRLAGHQHQPEEYHASAIVHLENFLGSTPAADRPDGFGGGLEELQAVLLLAGFALLRPVAPGLWYIVGVAVRLGVDLGLHYEDGVGIDGSGSEDQSYGRPDPTDGDGSGAANSSKIDAKERGRRQWVRDLRRRLWCGANQGNDFMHTKLPSPFLANFSSFREWRQDIDRRLLEWKDSAPTQLDAGVQFSPLFLELNYWQAVIMLYRQSLVVPSGLARELANTDTDVGSPSTVNIEEREDEEIIFLKVAEAGQKVLKLYRQLHRVHLSLDDVDFTVLAATSVLGDLIEKCPPAEACRDAFDRMSKATIQMCMSTTGFGPQALRALPQTQAPMHPSHSPSTTYTSVSDIDARSDAELTGFPLSNNYFQQTRRPVPRFDMNLKDLFSDDETDKRSFSRISNQISSMRPPPPPIKQERATHQMQAFSADLKMSPQLRNPQQQQRFATPASSSLSPPMSQAQMPPSPYQLSTQLPYSTFAQNVQSYPDLGFSDLDFLDSFPVQGTSGTMNTSSDTAGGLSDLGFGMGFGDGTHDWSDGNGFDLFDGFFFGPGGTGGM
ncbi:hypothetical protein BS50DRAFT_543264 [Corynespora cassiicola Philippines]|uniref:Zn(2)-C6 fungal-type domain-containing protein n=1 Tax=Corynespora cassiicola Philippines TaxID=1448308 RepID=A0A2T2P792_CORCC|nr:hypothetical protein BS50DRAFT_543264 [Corynespora cassiicola Philippines]